MNESNLGNPTLPALHGGVMGGFLETAGILHTIAETKADKIPKVIDFSIDYLSPARHRDTFAACKVVREGRKVVNVNVTAMQKSWDKPIAIARMNILL